MLTMKGKSISSGHNPKMSADMSTEASSWVTTDIAAATLEVSPRTVRRYIERGKLVGRAKEQGITKTWLVSIDSLQALRNQRPSRGHGRRASPAIYDVTDSMRDTIKWLTTRLEARTAEAIKIKARLELAEQAKATLVEERKRFLTELEREREQHREELESSREERQHALEYARGLWEALEAEQGKGFFKRLFWD